MTRSPPTRLPIAVRAFAYEAPPQQDQKKRSPTDNSKGPRKVRRDVANNRPSHWSLVLDCECTTEKSQRLRFGFYQVRQGVALFEEGVFADFDALTVEERAVLENYAKQNDLLLRGLPDFILRVFYRYGYDRRGSIVGFNLPFDLSRLASECGTAHGKTAAFSLEMTKNRRLPRIQIKHLNSRAALINFAMPYRGPDGHAAYKRGQRTVQRGFFLDARTLASALYSRSFTLSSLCDFLQTATRKQDTDEHGGPLSEDYIRYARTDVQATWECYQKLLAEFERHHLSQTPPHRLFSEASLGKAYLTKIGVNAHGKELSALGLSPALTGKVLCGYYGGRSEIHLRRRIARVAYTDFKSMYPTCGALQGLWGFVIADGIVTRDGTHEVRSFLDHVDLDLLQDPSAWRDLNAIVRVRPDDDLLPVRAAYDGVSNTIGLNYLTSQQPLWYALADCVAAKILTGKAPEILEAIRFEPGPARQGLNRIKLFGSSDYTVDPYEDDVFKRLIDLRDDVKDQLKRIASVDGRAQLEAEETSIKIIANATSYGVTVETIVDAWSDPRNVFVHGPTGPGSVTRTNVVESSGGHFNPIIGVLTTAGARLMLAITERLIHRAGLDWAFCDTDSMAIAMPETMDEAEFLAHVEDIRTWFEPLNPYEKSGSILKLEDHNYSLDGSGDLAPLYAWAISAKRYALFNVDADGRPVLRKVSAHGLGHLIAPYSDADAPISIPPPVCELYVARWQYDLWWRIVEAAQLGQPDQVDLGYHPNLNRPAVSRYAATTPRLLRYFDKLNRDLPYEKRVKPFNFMFCMTTRRAEQEEVVLDRPKRGRPRKARETKAVAPYDKTHDRALAEAFDRETGQPINTSRLQTNAEAVATYHLHSEEKFLNASALSQGMTVRRHVVATRADLIGKEANRWEEQMVVGEDEETEVSYGALFRR